MLNLNLKKNKEIEIMNAAMKIYRKKGIDKTSIRDIMSETGYSLGSFYLYFTDKEDLKEKLVVNIAVDLVLKAENSCYEKDPVERYISFINYIFDYFIDHPFELEIISQNINWALYSKIENDKDLKEAETTLQFILNRYESLFSSEYTYSQKLYILSLTIEILISTCKSTLMEGAILTIEEAKPVLYSLTKKMFYRDRR
ncbi:TetR/AcrR family transcriptional regulator [Citroniella saccharovorans]|uniref:TetR/AcrR family transcriptional regulator n=2 Tax=Citroniella saccharovorans TaxID=2053367 RepID=A0AAW9MV18_9FIRM|nr:TetR/AcrR family transcriptional regulator [Citroniella saccharovorans]MEB3429459.1 TetR/AcrR family transcriptional regulator [Citroniella saccharovorans]